MTSQLSVPFVPENPRRRRRRRSVAAVHTAAEGQGQDTSMRGLTLRKRTGPRPAERPRQTPEASARSEGVPVLPRPPRVRRRLKPGGLYRWMRRFRIPLAVLLGLCAVLAVLLAREPEQGVTVTAVRAVSDLAAGQVLTAAVLEEVEVDVEAVPRGHSIDVEALIGESVAVAVPAGALVHTTQLVGPGLLAGYGPGTVAVPVRPADTAIIGLLSPGQRVDVTASSDSPENAEGTRRVADAATVLWVPQDESENWLGSSSQGSNVVILAVDAPTAERIAEASLTGRIHLSLIGHID